jgi:DNA-binding response OmpR family regulator
MVYIDEEKMEKVFHNLLSNAFKFTKEDGEIALLLKSEGKQCNISVIDTGIGIPSNQLDKVFDRFHQADSSHTRSYEGSGLGMALAKELVELHHGTISVESTEGKGTTFTVTLRLGKDHLKDYEIVDTDNLRKSSASIEEIFMSQDQREESNNVDSSERPIVLIAEDNADMRHYIWKILNEQYQILEATNGKEGLAISKDVIPDLIVSDVMMPEMDGYKLCHHIRTNERTSHIPVILLTAKADHRSKLDGLETGADDYLSKPFDADELKLVVKNRIDQRNRIRERFSREITIGPKQISITSMDEKFLGKVLAIIEEHMDDEQFSIDELSREAGYSNVHFYRKIKALTGEKPNQFLRTIRLKRAAELLRKKSDNITQIAYSVGFSSLSYFSKTFKEQFGVTPGQFSEKNSES